MRKLFYPCNMININVKKAARLATPRGWLIRGQCATTAAGQFTYVRGIVLQLPRCTLSLALIGWIHCQAPQILLQDILMTMEERLTTAVARSFFISPFDKSIIAWAAVGVKLKGCKLQCADILINI